MGDCIDNIVSRLYLTRLCLVLSCFRVSLFVDCSDFRLYRICSSMPFHFLLPYFIFLQFCFFCCLLYFHEDFKNDIQVEGMQKPCSGSVNKTLPEETMWKIFPCHIFFGRDSSSSWGPGGVAFLNPEKNFQHKAYMCLHKIS